MVSQTLVFSVLSDIILPLVNYNDCFFSEITADDLSVVLGENATISCVVTGISSDVTIVFNDGTDDLSTEAGVYTVDSGTFTSGDTNKTATLTVIEIAEDATFTCKVSSPSHSSSPTGSEEQSITVYDVTLTPGGSIIEAEENITFTCVAVGDSSISLEWYNSDGTDLTSTAVQGSYNSSAGTLTSTLTLTEVTVAESSVYTCRLDFTTDSIDKTNQLDVVGKCFKFSDLDRNSIILESFKYYSINSF
jgi:hypothetical protein